MELDGQLPPGFEDMHISFFELVDLVGAYAERVAQRTGRLDHLDLLGPLVDHIAHHMVERLMGEDKDEVTAYLCGLAVASHDSLEAQGTRLARSAVTKIDNYHNR